MSTEKRVNIGLIGAGWWANTMHMPALAACDQANVVVENLEAAMQHLHTLNVEIVGGPRPRGDGVQQIYICDPDGHMIELFVWEAR